MNARMHARANERTNGRMNARTHARTNERTDGRMDGWTTPENISIEGIDIDILLFVCCSFFRQLLGGFVARSVRRSVNRSVDWSVYLSGRGVRAGGRAGASTSRCAHSHTCTYIDTTAANGRASAGGSPAAVELPLHVTRGTPSCAQTAAISSCNRTHNAAGGLTGGRRPSERANDIARRGCMGMYCKSVSEARRCIA